MMDTASEDTAPGLEGRGMPPPDSPDEPELPAGGMPPAAASPAYKMYGSASEFNAGELHPVVPFTQRAVNSANNIISAFGHAIADPITQTGPLGASEESLKEMRDMGYFNDYVKGENNFGKTVNEAVFRAAAVGYDASVGSVGRGIQIVGGVAGDASESAFSAVGFPQTGAALKAMEEFYLSGYYHAGAPVLGVRIPTAARMAYRSSSTLPETPAPLPPEVAAARATGVIGEGEAGFFGTRELTPEDVGARGEAEAQWIPEEGDAWGAMQDASSPFYGKFARWMRESAPETPEPSIEPAPNEPVETRTHDEIARSLEPQLYKEYDDLTAKRKWYGDTYREMVAARDEENANASTTFDEQAKPLQDRMDAILQKVSGVEERLTKGRANEVAGLRKQIEDLTQKSDVAKQAETPDMQLVREALERVNARLGEIADTGRLAEANRAAAEMNPRTETFAPEPPAVTPPAVKSAPDFGEPVGKSYLKEPAKKGAAKPEFSIADDIKRKLEKSGYSEDQINANASLVQAFYKTISDIYKGAKGSAEDVYKKYAPDIKISDEAGKKGASGSYKTKSNLTTLFKARNPSTLMHEYAHHFSSLLREFSKEEGAPEQLKKDYQTLRDYAGGKDDKPLSSNGEEKIARGFERYLHEGIAPSKELAGVFSRFKQWMTSLYKSPENIPLAKKITPEVRAVFDRMLAGTPEKIAISPEGEDLGGKEADIVNKYSDPALKNATEGELEDAIKQKEDAIEQAGGTDRIAGSGRKPADETGGKGNAGQAERPSGPDAGESGKSAGDSGPDREPPASILDKDGKINKDALNYSLYNNTPDWLQKYFNEYAERNGTAFSGDVETLESMQRLTEATGWTAKEIGKMEIGQKQSRLQQLASANLFKDVTERIIAAAEKAASGKPEDIQAFFENTQDHELLMKLFKDQKEYSAEASRGLGIRRAIKDMGGSKAEHFAELFQRLTDKNIKDVSKQAELLQRLVDAGQKGSVEKFLKDGSETKWQRFKKGMVEYYVNALISGPFTHTRYAAGNAVKVMTKPLIVTPMQAAIGSIRDAGSRAIGRGAVSDRVYWGEVGAQLYAMGKGSRDGLRAAIVSLKTGQSPFLPGETPYEARPSYIPGIAGKILTSPGRPVAAIHSFFKELGYSMEISRQSYRMASKEGLEGDAFDRRVADLTQNPSEDMMQYATKDSLRDIYMERSEYGSALYHMNAFTNKWILAKIAAPFIKIGMNITREAFVESTPLGIFSDSVRNNLLGRNGGAARDIQMGKIAFGTALMGTMAMMTMEGNATGDGPTDPKERAEWLLTHRPNTLTIGDLTIRYQGLGSLGMLMRFAANMTETAHHLNDEEGGKLAGSFFEGITKSVLDDNWMRGVKDALDAVYHHEEYGARYLQNMATNWLPFSVGMGQVSRAIDPFQRDIRYHGMENGFGILDAARAKMPFLSHDDLAMRYDAFGQPIRNGGARGYESDPVVQRLDALQIFPSKLGRKIRGVELTDQQYAEYARTAGVLVKERLNQIVTQSGFDNLSKATQIALINQTIKLYREQARSKLMMNYPDIMQRAIAEKKKDLNR